MIFLFELWLIVGILLCVAEFFTGSYIALGMGLSALSMAAVLFLFPLFTSQWFILLFIYGILSLIISIVLMQLFRKTSTTDINET